MAFPTTLALITALWSAPARTRSIALWLGAGAPISGLAWPARGHGLGHQRSPARPRRRDHAIIGAVLTAGYAASPSRRRSPPPRTSARSPTTSSPSCRKSFSSASSRPPATPRPRSRSSPPPASRSLRRRSSRVRRRDRRDPARRRDHPLPPAAAGDRAAPTMPPRTPAGRRHERAGLRRAGRLGSTVPRLRLVPTVVSWIVGAASVYVAAGIVAGVSIDNPAGALLIAAVIALFNAVLPPVIAVVAGCRSRSSPASSWCCSPTPRRHPRRRGFPELIPGPTRSRTRWWPPWSWRQR